MDLSLFNSELWKPALDKFTEATGLEVKLFGTDAKVQQGSVRSTPLVELFIKYGVEPGLFAACAHRCLQQSTDRPAVIVAEEHELMVVGTSLALEGAVVGAAVAGYAFGGFSHVAAIQRWAKCAGVPFESLWNIARQQPPVPRRRLRLHGELLQVLGDALLRENHRTRQYEDAVVKLEAAAAAKDEFMAVVSHELRTPLAPILGWAGVLKKSPSPAQVRRAAEVIERNVLLQTRMVEDLLDLNLAARGTVKLDLAIRDLAVCVRAVLEASAPDIEKKEIHLEVVDAGEPILVEADIDRLQQIFGNIISNALKFTPVGGAIRVDITTELGSAKVVVADTGAGISAAFLPFVFDMFQQEESGTQRSYAGLGIGLALVKNLTEVHKGTVSVTSAGSSCGTQVTVRLPLALAAVLRDAVASAEKPSTTALAGLSVLVVDDIEDARETLRILLQHLGAKVAVARNGREGLVMVRDAGPDLVLCDLRMPEMDGFEFMRELQRATPPAHPPVVAVTAMASDTDRLRTREAGFEAHINKPYDEAAILAAVDAALRPHAGVRHAVAMGAAGPR
ncbi:MAG: hybrid sensor histidine kinase/response regulator [Betaproteobacteria bacterium]